MMTMMVEMVSLKVSHSQLLEVVGKLSLHSTHCNCLIFITVMMILMMTMTMTAMMMVMMTMTVMIIDTRSCTQGKLSVHPDSPTHSDYSLAMIKKKMLIIMKEMLLIVAD